jgi:DNA invertase Pin-like site-specific DNA recombinase
VSHATCHRPGLTSACRHDGGDEGREEAHQDERCGEQNKMLAEMLADVRNGKVRVLVCWHSNRLERRGGRALLNLLAGVQDAGGRVESVKEPELGAVNVGG